MSINHLMDDHKAKKMNAGTINNITMSATTSEKELLIKRMVQIYIKRINSGLYHPYPNALRLITQYYSHWCDIVNAAENDIAEKKYSEQTREKGLAIFASPPEGHPLLATEEQKKMFAIVGTIASKFILDDGDFLGIPLYAVCGRRWFDIPQRMRQYVDRKDYENSQCSYIREKDFTRAFVAAGIPKTTGLCYINRLIFAVSCDVIILIWKPLLSRPIWINSRK